MNKKLVVVAALIFGAAGLMLAQGAVKAQDTPADNSVMNSDNSAMSADNAVMNADNAVMNNAAQ